MGLYADDKLLYLGDHASFLTENVSIIEKYGCYSGLTIYWDKSVVMHEDAPDLSPDQSQTPLISSLFFKYLGIHISTNLRQYESINLDPIIHRFTQKLEVWCTLPLLVVGSLNLIKMLWMPQLLCVIHNAPVWIPHIFFYNVNSLFCNLVWSKEHAQIGLETLHLMKDEGGLAVPNSAIYYLAA